MSEFGIDCWALISPICAHLCAEHSKVAFSHWEEASYTCLTQSSEYWEFTCSWSWLVQGQASRNMCVPISPTRRSDKVSVLAHIGTYPHKPLRKTTVAICNHQAVCPFCLWLEVWFYDLQTLKSNSMVIHNTKCPCRDQLSLNNTLSFQGNIFTLSGGFFHVSDTECEHVELTYAWSCGKVSTNMYVAIIPR